MNGKLGIIEIRNLVSAIYQASGFDFGDYALISFKRRLERVLRVNGLTTVEETVEKIKNDRNFIETILSDISVDETEMFRDPYLWRYFHDDIMAKIAGDYGSKIWIPAATSGDELFTTAIILFEDDLLDEVKIVATFNSERQIDMVRKGVVDVKKMETNLANYKRYRGKTPFTNYYEIRDNKVYMDISLLRNVEFMKHNLITDKAPSRIKMVLFRNKLIYFNQVLQNKIITQLHETILPGGFFIIGVKEVMDAALFDKKFTAINKTESVYKKSSGS